MIRAVALVLCLSAPPEKTVGYGNVLVRVPEGWVYDYKEEGLFLQPGDLKEDEALVVVISLGRKTEGSLAEGFEAVWKRAAGKRTVIHKAPEREFKTTGGVDGLLTVGLIDLGENSRMIATVAAFKPGDRIEAAIAMTAQQRVFERYSEPVRAMFRALRFRNVELPVSYELLLASKPGEPPVFRCLFADGSLLATLPPEGMEGFDPAEARTRFEKEWGTHQKKDGGWVFRVGERQETRAAADCSALAPSTGLKLDGRYGGVEFRADGSYADPGGVVRAGSGRYEIVRNTITFIGSEGRLKSLRFAASGEQLLIGGTWLKKS
jgi:hypothetical protein